MSQGSPPGQAPPGPSGSPDIDQDPFLSRFTEMADTLEDGITIQDPSGRVIYANDTAGRACGFKSGQALVKASPEKVMARFRLLDEEENPLPWDQLPGRIALGGEPSSEVLVCYHIKATGERRWAEIKSTPVFDDEGEVAWAVNVIHDVTKLKHTEDELRQARDELGARVEARTRQLRLVSDLIDQTNDAIFVVDPETARFIYVNQQAAEGLGYEPEVLLDLKVIDVDAVITQMEDWDAFVDELAREGTVRMENELHRADGQTFLGEINASLVQEHGDDYIVAIVRDISERKATEQRLEAYAHELERSNKELQDFAHIISHDLQAPLRMVGSYVELLERRYGDQLDTDAEEFIRFAVDGVRRMEQLIKGLLAYSRIESRGNPFETVALDDILEGVLANLATTIKDEGARVTHDPLPSVEADPAQMTQLLQNLVGNAIKFHGDQAPEVHIRARDHGDRMQLMVEDNGIGIDPEQSERIFKVFQRLHTEDEFAGTGMGLAICKRIAERHGGTIRVDSTPGQGATFIVEMPTDPGRSTASPPEPVTAQQAPDLVDVTDT